MPGQGGHVLIPGSLPDSMALAELAFRPAFVPASSPSMAVLSRRDGDRVCCTVSELQPLRAEPEDIPLDIVYEDSHVLVVNKPAHMVVHPAPGNANGTLVNAILHHCRLPTMSCTSKKNSSEAEELSEFSEDELDDFHVEPSSTVDISSGNYDAHIRPGIVHRLDKGTSGLLVVAKDEDSHAHLAEQFKSHTIRRVYISLTSGVPSPSSGRIEVPIARDPNNRVRMAAVAGSINSKHVRYAASIKYLRFLPMVVLR
ncbi:23S rRNA pseudouridine(1911/1915/1917) synthase protein [Dioscorea alata]|uniref:23S rRNA pseudouridine(1911/1915/1917) synthase protein n=1 Tax=Dioscorea alata TaxID=55571 RepID=A0ACB7WPK7_DIOAL|nr:23S rRNA pseudouridine(1911/1915/1917) synthase protein [Dioscorea alata]